MKKFIMLILFLLICFCMTIMPGALADGGSGVDVPRVTIYAYDMNGNWLMDFSIPVASTQYVDPPAINGYYSVSESVYVRSNGVHCSPNFLTFYYDVMPPEERGSGANDNPGPGPAYNDPNPSGPSGIVYPMEWDTQFRPGLALKEHNLRRFERLYNVNDDNYSTAFEWLIYSSERTDNIPELTAFFNGSTISKVGIRNGYLKNSTDYYRYARASEMDVTVYDFDGNSFTTRITIPDIYTTEYHVFELGRVYSNVSKVEFWLRTFNYDPNEDNGHRYIIFISDIQFYQ